MPASAYFSFYPLSALRATSPEGGSKLPGGWRSTEYIFRTFSGGLPRHFVPRNDNDQGDGSVGYFAIAQYDALGLVDCRGTSCLAMTVEFKKCGGGNFASAALVRLRVKINIKLSSE